MDGVFISYRRSDSAAMCDRIYEALANHFGKDQIFKDVDNIPLGVNFSDYIRLSLAKSAVALIIIGRTWLDVKDAQGRRRLDDPTDWVRLEIEEALALGIPVIPLRVDGAPMPDAASLPPSLRGMLPWSGWEVHYAPYFDVDMRRIEKDLERLLPSLAARRAAYTQQAAQAVRPAQVYPAPGAWYAPLPIATLRAQKPPLPWWRIVLYGLGAGLAAIGFSQLSSALASTALRGFVLGPVGIACFYIVVALAGIVPAFMLRLRAGRFAAGMVAALLAETLFWAVAPGLSVNVRLLTPMALDAMILTLLFFAVIFGPGIGAILGLVGNWAAMLWLRLAPRRATSPTGSGGATRP